MSIGYVNYFAIFHNYFIIRMKYNFDIIFTVIGVYPNEMPIEEKNRADLRPLIIEILTILRNHN